MTHMDRLEELLALLDEARGFAAMSPQGRDNIVSVWEMLPDLVEQAYRTGFEDGEKHAAEHAGTERKGNSSFVPVPNSGTFVPPDLEHLGNLRAALEPFRSGGDWGKIKAWVVAGAPNTDDARASMKWLTSCQVAVGKALSPPAREEGGRDDGR